MSDERIGEEEAGVPPDLLSAAQPTDAGNATHKITRVQSDHAPHAPVTPTPPLAAFKSGGVTFHAAVVTSNGPASIGGAFRPVAGGASATPTSILKTARVAAAGTTGSSGENGDADGVSTLRVPTAPAASQSAPLPSPSSREASTLAVDTPMHADLESTESLMSFEPLILSSPSESPPSPLAVSDGRIPAWKTAAVSPLRISATSSSSSYAVEVYPSFALIFRQLKQFSLWDRLFTHCTGRDLICKFVQHTCGLLRGLIQLWEWGMKRLARDAAFRRMFGRLPPMMAPPAAGASKAVALTESVVSTASESSNESDFEAWVPPAEEDAPPRFVYRLQHIYYTMDRARQVLRFGRWLYDIPDVRDSAVALWCGEKEEKSIEEQEAEEEWEEHERVHVARSRRTSLDAGSSRGGGGSMTPTSGAGKSGHHREASQSARGTFIFPPASLSSRAGPTPPSLPTVFTLERVTSTSSTVSTSSSTDIAAMLLQGDVPSSEAETPTDVPSNATSRASSSLEHDDEDDDDSMTLLERTVGVVDLANSLMGLVIDASDDIAFISSVGLLSSRVGDAAGRVSHCLWLVSGTIDFAMCWYKLRAYRAEMLEAAAEAEEDAAAAAAERAREQQWIRDSHARVDKDALVDLAPLSSPILVARPSSPCRSSLTLCTSACDVDCFHIEYLRFYRYLGELGVALCGVALGDDLGRDRPLQTALEAAGLFSACATFAKRAATHARSTMAAKRRHCQHEHHGETAYGHSHAEMQQLYS